MKMNKVLKQLKNIKKSYQTLIRENFEFKAKECVSCPTQGACCLDAHFVNVHITRLEAEAIQQVLGKFSEEKRAEIYRRIEETIEEYKLQTVGDTFAQTFACPLFERGIGCLVHETAKPLPCIQHACYEREEDLPPQFLQDYQTEKVEKLNREVYGDDWRWLPMPVWLILTNNEIG
jgi:hypothetical protein